jgi:hypothetical protein
MKGCGAKSLRVASNTVLSLTFPVRTPSPMGYRPTAL